MDKTTRSAIERATQQARKLLQEDFSSQLEGTFDVLRSGAIGPQGGVHLSARQHFQRGKIVAVIDHKQAAGMPSEDAITDFVRDAAFTTLNRFVALKMLEARQLIQECITKGEQSSGYKEFCGMAPALALLPEGAGYRLYIESLFDEFSTEIKVLFDRRDAASILWPKRATFDALLAILNATELSGVWDEDETIGWVYQYFNSRTDIDHARYDKSGKPKSPQTSRELAARNQFFTPRYVVRFLTENTLGRIWLEMRGGDTQLSQRCNYLVLGHGETWDPRPKKDPRDLKILDPACGSGHFLLYCFDLLLVIYEEAWADPNAPKSDITGRTLREDFPEIADLRNTLPRMVLLHNLYGVDIDPRCAQIAQLALWMRAQRAFKDFGLSRSDRPFIRRVNIVIAEPMPGEEGLMAEFLRTLQEEQLEGLIRRSLGVAGEHKVRATKAMAESLKKLVATVWNGMKYAGELGMLLKIDRDITRAITMGREEWEEALPLFRDAEYGLTSATEERLTRDASDSQPDFWAKAESLLFQALADYAENASGLGAARRRLFAEDAVQGFALADIMGLQFDVVLMNPPFGAVTDRTRTTVESSYPDSRYDIGAMFIEECIGRLAPQGRLGAIFNRTNWFLGRLKRFRSRQLQDCWLPCNADLGLGVLDAFVETALTVIEASKPKDVSYWIRLVDDDQKSDALSSAIESIVAGDPNAKVFTHDQSVFSDIEGCPYSYWVPSSLLKAKKQKALADRGFEAKQGLATKDNFRFLRLQWEVQKSDGEQWKLYSKGGAYAPLVGTYHLVIDWGRAAHAAYAVRDGQFCCLLTGQSHRYKFRPSVTYSQRTSKFSARIFPGGGLFDTKGSVVFSPNVKNSSDLDDELIALCLILNTDLAQFFFDSSAGASDEGKARDYSQGMVGGLPAPTSIVAALQPVIPEAREIFALIVRLQSFDPTSVYYRGIQAAESWLREEADAIVAMAADSQVRLGKLLTDAATCYAGSIGLTEEDKRYVERIVRDMHRAATHEALDISKQKVFSLRRQSVLLEVLGGKLKKDHSQSVVACETEPLRAIPWSALSNTEFPKNVCVDDPGHVDDLPSKIGSYLEALGVEEQKISSSFGIDNIRTWCRSEAFAEHVALFSRSQRSAPVAWQLSTVSCTYSVWLYAHGLDQDTLFRVQTDYVGPKLEHERRKLEALRAEAGATPGSAQRKNIDLQEGFVAELQAFFDEIKRIAPLWNPHLDDGVIINFAPLWKLVPHNRTWQSELQGTWRALADGEYDWTHLAMHLWPERVVPKCVTDRSLAISHGLEDVFWVEADDDTWKPRTDPQRTIDELVRERTSLAAKAALLGLTDAPAANASKARKRRSA